MDDLRRVTLPVLRPGLLGATIVTAVLAVESFEVPLLLAGGAKAEIFSVRLYTALNDASGAPPDYGTAAALGLHFLIITYVLFSLFQFLTRRGDQFTTIGGRTLQPRRHSLGPWRWPVLTVLAFLLSIVSAAPFAVLVWTSLLPQYLHLSTVALGQVSLDQYRALFADSRLWGAWRNTVLVALAAPTISVGVSAAIAWVVVRARPGPWRTTLDLFMSSSIAIPAAVAGSAFLLFYVRLDKLTPVWLPLLGTVFVLVLVYAHRLTVAYRISQTSLLRIGAVLEEASATSGARPMQTMLRIVLPLAAPGLAAAWVTLLVVAVRELTLPLIVGRESPPLVISVLVWKLWGLPHGTGRSLRRAHSRLPSNRSRSSHCAVPVVPVAKTPSGQGTCTLRGTLRESTLLMKWSLTAGLALLLLGVSACVDRVPTPTVSSAPTPATELPRPWGSETRIQFRFPHGVAVHESGAVYVAYTSDNLVRKFSIEGHLLQTLGGQGELGAPVDVAVGPQGASVRGGPPEPPHCAIR